MLDGLNECFIAHPVFDKASIVGGVLTMCYGHQPVQLAGLGLEIVAGVVSATTSYLRTRAYVKAINADLLHPARLSLNILTTEKMLERTDFPDAKISVPRLEADLNLADMSKDAVRDAAAQDDQVSRIAKALEGHVTPITLDVPEQIAPDNLLKKMSAHQAQKLSEKNNKKANKQQYKSLKRSRKAERAQARGDRRLAHVDAELAQARAQLDTQMAQAQDEATQHRALQAFKAKESDLNRRREKVLAKTSRRVEKRERKAEKFQTKVDKKEDHVANKIRWIVISPWDGDADSEDDAYPSEDESGK